jgi:beta-phosphoglucomutase-like phosphatase (HAD superfamily)
LIGTGVGVADVDHHVDLSDVSGLHRPDWPDRRDRRPAGARALGLEPQESVVFEDALAGVEAGRAGGFLFVVGIDRAGQADALRKHGADIVVDDLAELLDHS